MASSGGQWRSWGTTPLSRRPYWYDMSAGVVALKRTSITVRVEKDGFWPQQATLYVYGAPEESIYHFTLVQVKTCTVILNTDPEGASVEVMEEIMVLDPSSARMVGSGKSDWVFRGTTPLILENIRVGSVSILVIRLRKDGYEESIINIPVGQQDKYTIPLKKETP